MPNGSAGATHFLCPTLSAKLWPSGLLSGAGGSATSVVVSVDSLSGVRLREDMLTKLLVDMRANH